jgi:hypothetical protein
MTERREMKTAVRTDDLIGGLAAQAGGSWITGPHAFKAILTVVSLASLCLSVAVVLAWYGVRPDLMSNAHREPLAYKVASMLALGLGGLVLASRAALPGSRRLTVMAFVPAVLILAFRVATDRSGLSILGNSSISAHACVLTILGVSLPPLVILFAVMRMGAVTRPTVTGAIVGALSGSLGATAYALACRNDAGLFGGRGRRNRPTRTCLVRRVWSHIGRCDPRSKPTLPDQHRPAVPASKILAAGYAAASVRPVRCAKCLSGPPSQCSNRLFEASARHDR